MDTPPRAGGVTWRSTRLSTSWSCAPSATGDVEFTKVSDDSHGLQPGRMFIGRALVDALAERIFVRPVSTRHALIDYHHLLGSWRVAPGEVPSGNQGNRHRFEVSGRNDVIVGHR